MIVVVIHHLGEIEADICEKQELLSLTPKTHSDCLSPVVFLYIEMTICLKRREDEYQSVKDILTRVRE